MDTSTLQAIIATSIYVVLGGLILLATIVRNEKELRK